LGEASERRQSAKVEVEVLEAVGAVEAHPKKLGGADEVELVEFDPQL